MRGRGALIGLEIYLSQSGEHGLSRPLTASHNLSCDLSEPIRREHGLSCTASHGLSRPLRSVRPWESEIFADRPLTHTGRSNAFSREISQASPRMTASAVRVRSERPCRTSTGRSNAFSREISQAAPRIGLHRPVCVRGRSAPRTPTRPLTASHGLSLRTLTASQITDHVY